MIKKNRWFVLKRMWWELICSLCMKSRFTINIWCMNDRFSSRSQREFCGNNAIKWSRRRLAQKGQKLQLFTEKINSVNVMEDMHERLLGLFTFVNLSSLFFLRRETKPGQRLSWRSVSSQAICWHHGGCHSALATERRHVVPQCAKALLAEPPQDHWYPESQTAFDL